MDLSIKIVNSSLKVGLADSRPIFIFDTRFKTFIHETVCVRYQSWAGGKEAESRPLFVVENSVVGLPDHIESGVKTLLIQRLHFPTPPSMAEIVWRHGATALRNLQKKRGRHRFGKFFKITFITKYSYVDFEYFWSFLWPVLCIFQLSNIKTQLFCNKVKDCLNRI